MSDANETIQAYLNGELAGEALERFEARLAEDPGLLREWVGACFLDHELRRHFKRQSADVEPAPAMSLAELARLEETAEAEPVHLVAPERMPARDPRPGPDLSPREIASAAGFLLGRALTSRPARRAYAYTAAAAALLLAVVWLLPSNDPAPRPTAQQNTPPQAAPTAVATLTAEYDAQWAAFKLSAGDTLYANQRLTLTEGFAEVTTNRGAVAILEAPATIELLDDANAMRLHRGKLVGICETRSSKGFVVRTEHLDITDVGTRFGVDVTAADRTDVQVLDGEVRLSRPGQSGVAERLAAGQAVRIHSQAGEMRPIAFTPYAYTTHASKQAHALRQYAQAVHTARPLCYWPLDNAPADGPIDNAMPDQPGLHVLGQPEWISEGQHRFARFDGVPTGRGDLLHTGDRLDELEGATELSVEAWVRPVRYHRGIVFNFFAPGDVDTPANRDAAAASGFASHVAFLEFVGDPFATENQGERNKMSFWLDELGTTAAPGETISSQEYPLKQWLHVVAVIRDGQIMIFVDGKRFAEGAAPARFETAPALCFAALAEELAEPIPGPEKVTRRLAGDLDQLAVYRYAMTPDVIAEHHRLMREVVEAHPTN